MGMSTHIVGIKPADDRYKKMLSVWTACRNAGIDPPDDVTKFFDYQEPEPSGVVVGLASADGVHRWSDDYRDGYEVELSKLDPNIKILRFYNSY